MISDWDNYQEGDILDVNRKSPADFIDEIKMEYIRPYLPISGTILELGAGSGRLLTRIGLESPDDFDVIGLDYSPTSTKTIKGNIKKHNLNGDSICGDVMHIPLSDKSVDMVCSGGLLEHFNSVDVYVVLSEMYRVLRPGGVLYADIVPGKRSLCRLRGNLDAGGYENKLRMSSWDILLIACGFSMPKIFSCFVLPPNFYGLWTGTKCMNLIYKHKNLIKSLDNTWLSDMFGFAYIVFAHKR